MLPILTLAGSGVGTDRPSHRHGRVARGLVGTQLFPQEHNATVGIIRIVYFPIRQALVHGNGGSVAAFHTNKDFVTPELVDTELFTGSHQGPGNPPAAPIRMNAQIRKIRPRIIGVGGGSIGRPGVHVAKADQVSVGRCECHEHAVPGPVVAVGKPLLDAIEFSQSVQLLPWTSGVGVETTQNNVRHRSQFGVPTLANRNRIWCVAVVVVPNGPVRIRIVLMVRRPS